MMKHGKPTWFSKFEALLSNLVDKYDEGVAESIKFRRGEFCKERRVFLREIRIIKILLCIDLICTLILELKIV